MSQVNDQPWLQAILTIAKHYRIESSAERIKLQLDWSQQNSLDDLLEFIAQQAGLKIRRVTFEKSLFNPWRLPLLLELNNWLHHFFPKHYTPQD